jgi:hypothetical protein
MARGVLAHHRLARRVGQHDLHMVVVRRGDEVGQRLARQRDALEQRAQPLHLLHLQRALLQFMPHPLHRGVSVSFVLMTSCFVDNVNHDPQKG